MENDQNKFNDMQTLKRSLFAMRNGVIADTLRKAGSPFRVIFGVNLPQLVEIAHQTGQRPDLAERLWHNTTTRESMLLAPMLMPVDAFAFDDALRWIAQVPAAEVADVLCHRLLRHTPYALRLVDALADDESPLQRYTALRLMCSLASAHPDKARHLAEAELARADTSTLMVASQLLDRTRDL